MDFFKCFYSLFGLFFTVLYSPECQNTTVSELMCINVSLIRVDVTTIHQHLGTNAELCFTNVYPCFFYINILIPENNLIQTTIESKDAS